MKLTTMPIVARNLALLAIRTIRRLLRRLQRAGRVGLKAARRRAKKLPVLWLRFPNEAVACPGCASAHTTLLDAFTIQRTPDRRRMAFLSGCRECGLLFANPLPTKEQLLQYYSADGPWAARRAERMQWLEAAHRQPPKPRQEGKAAGPLDLLLDALVAHVPVHAPPAGAKVLDFGCGDGKLLNRLQDRGWETYGVEPSSDVAFLRHIRVEAPVHDASFDLVMLLHVLEHVRAPLDLLRQLAGTLREGGVLVVIVPKLDTLPQHRDFHYCIDGRRHLLAFSERCLTGLLARAGFAVTARLDLPELDRVQTDGQPLRLRLVATRTASPPAPPAVPLAPAIEALQRYASADGGVTTRIFRRLPVRMRAASIDRARERARSRATSPVPQ